MTFSRSNFLLVVITCLLVVSFTASGQILLSEDFNGSSGTSLNSLGWNQDCGSSPELLLSSTGLIYPGYIGSGIGNAVQLLNGGSGNGYSYSKNFGSSPSPVYVSFLINVTNAPGGGLFAGGGCSAGTPWIIAFGGSGGSSNDNGLFVQNDGPGTFRVGLKSDCCGSTTGSTILSYSTTYLVVMKQDFGSLRLYVNPALGNLEPGIAEAQISISGTSLNDLNLSSRAEADLLLDGIRVSGNWSDLVFTSPSIQASDINFPVISATNSINLSWTNGNGNGRIVVAKAGGAVTGIPVDGTTYFGSSTFGSGNEIGAGTGNYVVFSSCCGSNINVTNLNPATTYSFWVFEYNQSGSSILYNLSGATANPASQSTLFTEPSTPSSGINFTNKTPTGITVNWTNGNGTERLVLAKIGGIFTPPLDGIGFTGNANFLSAPDDGNGAKVVYRGAGNFVNVIGLNPETFYDFAVFELNGTGATANYNGSIFNNTNEKSTFTLANEPLAQPTGLTFNSITTSGHNANFSSGVASGYLVLRKLGSSPAETLVDGVQYFAGNNLGTSFIVQSGSLTFFASSGLTSASTYHYDIYAFNGSGESINYRTITPLEGSGVTLFDQPATQASNLSFSTLGTTSYTLSWANGNGANRLVVARQGSAVNSDPVDGTDYTASASFGSGTQIGSGNYVVYEGNGSSVPLTNLVAATSYHFKIYEFNGTVTQINYNINTTTGNPSNRATLDLEPSAHPASFTSANAGSSQINLSFPAASTITNADGYVILRRQDGTNPTTTGVNNGTAPGSLPLTAGTTLVTTVTSTATTSFNNSGLTSGTNYNYAIIPYNYNGSNNETYNYRTAATVQTTASFTTAVEPTGQPTSIAFTSLNSNGYTVGWTAAAGSPAGYIAIRRLGSSPTGVPLDGTGYAVNNSIGDGTVAYVGSGTSFTETTLAAATVYHYDIFSFNGSGTLSNYLTSSPLEGSRTTLASEPAAQATALVFSSITTSSFSGSFTAATGSPAGYLVLRRQGASPTGTPSDGTTYTAGNAVGDGTVVSVGSSISFNEALLSSGTTYYYDVFSFNGSGLSINYRTATPLENSVITLPAAPVANAGSVFSTSAFTANWSASTGASGYRLDVSADNFSTFVAGFNNLTVAGTSQVVTGLTPGTTYQYRVRAVNASGASSNSSVTSNPTICLAPVANAVSGLSSSGFSVSWNSVTGASGYSLDVSANNFSSMLAGYNGLAVAGTSTVVTGLSPSTAYSYRVRATNSSGSSANSNTINATTLAPGPVASAATNITQTAFTANWSTVIGADNYSLDVGDPGFSSFVSGFSNLTVNGTSQSVSGLSPGTTYEYRLRSNNIAGASANSNVISVITIPAEPVTGAASNITATGFIANWSSVAGATSYLVEVSNNNFTTMLPGYSPKEVTTNSENLSGLTPGTAYSYRVRAKNISGQSGLSNVISQITIPPVPELKPFNQALANAVGFVAEWTPVPGADGYMIDVSTQASNFSSFVAGYNGKIITGGSASDEVVTGLVSGQFYRYRIRAFNAGGASGNSDPKLAVTSGGSYVPPTVTLGTATVTSAQASIAGGGGVVIKLNFFHRKITEKDFIMEPEQIVVAGTTTTALTSSYFDEIGMEYYFEVVDELENKSTTNRAFIYTPFSAVPIPELKAGGTMETYQIFSIPVELSDRNITNVFQEVISFYGGPDKTKWRLVRYQNGRNGDYPEVLTQIEKGKGYWFNAKDQFNVKVSGTSIAANQANDFKLALDAGWTQIGNPFPFPISWTDILAKNNNPPGVGKLYTYDAANVSFKESGGLKAWEGGFVKSDNATTLNIPVTVKQSATGRGKGYPEIESRDLASDEWFLPLKIQSGKAYNEMGGIGMHPDARMSNDQYDEQTLPRFIKYLELNSYHPEHFIPRFTRDVVPTAISHTWNFVVESNFEEKAVLSWDSKSLRDSQAQLMLYDLDANVLLDMKATHQYQLELSEKHHLKIFFSVDGKSLLPDITGVGRPYPNPSASSITIPFIVGVNDLDVRIALFDMMGKQVKVVANESFQPGKHEVTWDGNDEQGNRVAQGIYIYQLRSTTTSAQQGRVVLK